MYGKLFTLTLITSLLICFGFPKYIQAQSIVLRCDDYGYDDPDFYLKLRDLMEDSGAKLTVGAVPVLGEELRSYSAYQDSVLLMLAETDGFEIAQHGFSHKNWGGGTGEFAGRSFDAQSRDISIGRQVLEDKINKPIETFIPPWNAFDEATLQVMYENDFRAISGATSKGDYSRDIGGISFIPFTIDLPRLRSLADGKKLKKDAVYIVLFHAYDFADNAKFYQERDSDPYEIPYDAYQTNLTEFSDLLFLLSEEGVDFYTLSEIAESEHRDLFLAKSIRDNRMNLLLSPPPMLQISHPGYLSDQPNWLRLNSSLIVSLLFYTVLILVAFGLSSLVFSRCIFSRMLKYIALILVLITLAALLISSIASGSYGYLRLIAVSIILGSSMGILISLFRSILKPAKMRRV